MPRDLPDGRPPMVVAMHWVSQVTTISIEMALPAGLGYWLDQRWGTEPWLVVCGAVIGFAVGMWHLLQLAQRSGNDHPKNECDLRNEAHSE